MRQFLSMALERAGHKVVACSDGLEAMKAVESCGPGCDLLLADIVMPGLDGIELSQRTAALYPSIRVMFITGFAAVAMGGGRADNQNANARILSKPFHLNDLVRQVDEILAA